MYYDHLTPEAYERHFFAHPHMHGMKPFRMVGNLYFAGDDSVGVHLFDTGEGLILLDTGYPQMQGFLIHSIWSLGFEPRDVRYILHTHGHFDHIGGTNLLKELSGATTFMSAQDAQMLESRPELTFGAPPESLFQADERLSDGDVLRLGMTTIRVVSAPGHTMGTLAIFATVHENGKAYTAGMHGGIGLNTVSQAYIRQYRLPDMQALYRSSMERLKAENVDIVLGNHTRQNDTPGKYARLSANPDDANPFIDDREWISFLRDTERKFDEMRMKEKDAQ